MADFSAAVPIKVSPLATVPRWIRSPLLMAVRASRSDRVGSVATLMVPRPLIKPFGSPKAVMSISYWHTSVAMTIFLITTRSLREQATPILMTRSTWKRSMSSWVHRAAFTLPGAHCTTVIITPSSSPVTKSQPAARVVTVPVILSLMVRTSTSIAPIMPNIYGSPFAVRAAAAAEKSGRRARHPGCLR